MRAAVVGNGVGVGVASEVGEKEGPEKTRGRRRVVKIQESWGRWRFWGKPAWGREPKKTWVLTLGELKVGARWMLGREGQRETERDGEAVELTLK